MPERIYRGSSYRMGIEISESEQELSTLDVNLEARLEGTTDWTTDILGSPFFNSSSGGWECLLQPGLDSDVGNYSLKVTVIDNFGNSFEHVFPTQVTVLNNIPAPPVIEIRPRAPKTGDNLRAVMVQEGSDIETDTLVYSYRWFINGEPLSLYDSDSVQPFTDRMIDSVETAKGDMVSLMVYSFDGLNISDPFRVSVLIGNTPPIIQPDFPGNVSLMEDQENDTVLRFDEIAFDVDGDDIEIFSTEPLNVTMEIDADGKVIFFSPDENWFGDEMVTLTVSDGDNITYQDLLIEVIPVNDLPEGSILQPVGNLEIEVGDKVTFNADAYDIETEKENLEYTWMAGDEVLSTEPYFVHIFPTVGLFNISCLVSDGEDEVSLGSILINVVDTTPDYLKDDFQRYYPDNGKAIVYDVVDFKGNVKNVREDEGGKLDILSLSSELKGENVRITMNLASAPDNATSGDSTSIRYYVYFVKDEWSEPEFDSKLTGPETADRAIPLSQYFYNVGTYGSLGYLSFGTENDFGSPYVDGNSIIWTVPAVLIVNSGMELEDYGLYGLSMQTSETSMIITKGFDTIGKGSIPHQITGQPETSSENESENGASSLLMGLVIGAIILLVIFIILLIVMILMMRKKGAPSEDEPASDASQTYTGDEAPLNEAPADIPASAAPLPYEKSPGALPTSSDMEVNTGQLPPVEPPAQPGPVPSPATESPSRTDVPVQPMMTGSAAVQPPVPPQPGSGPKTMDGQQPPSA